MKKLPPILLLAISAGVVITFLAGPMAGAGEEEFVPMGAGKCKTCHKKEEVGAQFAQWEASQHAKAFETLGTPEAAAIAKEKGIEGSAQEAAECLKCHSTAFGHTAEALTAAKSKIDMAEGVSCEACHGNGSAYYKKKTMQAITDGEIDGTTIGLINPDEKTCRGCHNEESPTFKEFNFEEAYKEISHPRPDAAPAEK